MARAEEVVQHAAEHGDGAAMKRYNLGVGSLARYKAMCRGKTALPNDALRTIAAKYSPAELQAIARGAALSRPTVKVPPVDFDGECIRFGYLTDTHFGSLYSPPEFYDSAIAEFQRQDCAFVVHTGDLVEGMSNRPGHIYELSHLGFAAQKQFAVERLRLWDRPWYLIDGNHDRWFIKSAGAEIVPDVCEEIGATFLGHDFGELPLKGGVKVALWHGEDGASYATSYRLQKIVEGLSGGTKPNVMLTGHSHKHGYFFERNIHVISGGSIQMQTPWMRGKRYPAHPGFWIVDLWAKGSSVSRLTTTWYPFYA